MTPIALQIPACCCDKVAKYGYDIQRRTRGGKKWTYRPYGTARDIPHALAMTAGVNLILVRCNGCGNELLREYPK